MTAPFCTVHTDALQYPAMTLANKEYNGATLTKEIYRCSCGRETEVVI